MYVVWHNYNSTISDVFFKKVGNGGTTFGNTPINLSNDNAENAAGSGSAQLAVSGNNVYVIWYEFTASGKNTLFFRSSDDDGESFRNKLVIANAIGAAFPQQIAASDRDVYIVWQSNIGGNNNEVFFSESHDGGTNFQSSINLSNSTGESYSPQVATVKGSNVYVAWIDNAINSDTKDIVFSKGTSVEGSMQSAQQEPPKQIMITEVELSSANGTQWIEIHNPTATSFSTPLLINQSNTDKSILYSSVQFKPDEYNIIQIWNEKDGPGFQVEDAVLHVFVSDTVEVDATPPLTDNLRDSRTWQLNGTEWVFAEATPTRTIPEFPIAQLTIAVSVAGLIAIFSVRKKLFGKSTNS